MNPVSLSHVFQKILNQFLGIVNQFLGLSWMLNQLLRRTFGISSLPLGTVFHLNQVRSPLKVSFEGCTEESSDPEDQESCHEHEMQDGTLILEENLNGFTYGVFGNLERGSCSHGVFGEESCHMFRRFPQHVNIDSGDEGEDSACEPTEGCVSEGNSFMDVSTPEHSDGGGRGEIREEQPMAPVPEEEPFEPVMEGSSLLDHECRSH